MTVDRKLERAVAEALDAPCGCRDGIGDALGSCGWICLPKRIAAAIEACAQSAPQPDRAIATGLRALRGRKHD